MTYNRGMTHLDLLIPFALPPAELSRDLRKALDVPALATLTSRARADSSAAGRETFDAYARALPHEIWLTRQLGLEAGMQNGSSPPIAPTLLQEFGHAMEEGVWFVLHPVHLHIARDHLVLTHPRGLELEEAESQTLFDMARPLFEEYGRELIYGDAGTWFMRADDWAELQTATPDAAGGHNIDLWMPCGPGERDWRKLQNEVQMHWFTHPLNSEREARGARAVNSLWLWGGAHAAQRATRPYDTAIKPGNGKRSDWVRACTERTGASAMATDLPTDAATLLATPGASALLVLDDLAESALASDWGGWLESMRAIEQEWLRPLHDALRAGALDALTLIATDDVRLSRFTTTRSSLRKFWIKPTLSTLMP